MENLDLFPLNVTEVSPFEGLHCVQPHTMQKHKCETRYCIPECEEVVHTPRTTRDEARMFGHFRVILRVGPLGALLPYVWSKEISLHEIKNSPGDCT